jgi:hypothetical protein
MAPRKKARQEGSRPQQKKQEQTENCEDEVSGCMSYMQLSCISDSIVAWNREEECSRPLALMANVFE